MRLVELKHYLQEQKVTSLANLVTYFKVDPELLRDMLRFWENKGCVQKSLKTQSCKTKCMQCHPLSIEMYEWVHG